MLLAAATVSGFLLYFLTYNAQVDAERSAAETRAATQQSLRNAQRALEQSERTFKLSERAWMGVHGVSLENYLVKSGAKAKLAYVVVNAGKSPALEVRACSHLGTEQPSKMRVDRNYPECSGGHDAFRQSSGTIVPGTSMVVYAESETIITETAYASLRLGREHLYFWGWISYKDIFGIAHHTKFNSVLISVEGASLAPLRYGNETDEDERQPPSPKP